jgi:hypothetical protein
VVVEKHACWSGLVAADVDAVPDERLQAKVLRLRRPREMTEESQHPEVVAAHALDEEFRAKGTRLRRHPETTEARERANKIRSLSAVDLAWVRVSVAR